ncbi:ArsR/SmtB family transcription factor [Flavobacterium aurantiibacter]|uniref:Transcriptional regulator n=1 Tax=Flavobacterium aurantiibacter TaxID=2023067 RepID=A0A255ZQD2_9FLAO|nr:metalloregulator ArsR/SmtB family transcription factor [Flavobacterium aurantiibacter]OYQ43666.1 transcriptional regulator [Flavobacterium aurantiibacter]
MGITKAAYFTDAQNELADIAKALGNPARIAILDHLAKVNSCICGDLVTELPLAQATISQHLKELKNAKLIKGNIDGNAVCYCINHEVFNKFKAYLNIFSNANDNANTCCP